MSESRSTISESKDAPRIRLRPLNVDDAECLHEWMQDNLTRSFLSSYASATKEEIGAFIGRLREDGRDLLRMVENEKGDPVAVLALRNINKQRKTADTEALVNPKMRGMGVGTEAKMGLLRIAFEELGLKKLFALVNKLNPASLRYLEKQGYRRSGEMDDQIEMIITLEDWKQNSEGLRPVL
ncbi:MAG: hypothetical protein COV07_01360 [Candidatus Vogelbacteria bacterium CG10_big_fil_rev_8_21_14_0_10_45_14]|uniref:N-acetyltransferase domain-containing protein n=1 Tax=Candidatus Vogelbacteria bacterium CG10_big_fil_rev_8_21_14_0_10_45_14 TaxID=1975042 RepID=A0A2H0RKK8_9BACT|nr:MAG: hypothetical protein COV07_01360 [Candidatus Vogelbacteria bacterium CG10_big_fil_rev_8_21_14_0_10_45_14]